jgi:hypothetical protein
MPVPSEILNNLVDVGNVANDGSGDDLRDAFVKINDNIVYVAGRIGTAVSGANIGATGQPIFKETIDAELNFRKINATQNLGISTVDDVITLTFSPTTAVAFNGQAITGAGNITSTGVVTAASLVGPLTGSISGNAETVTNGVYTTGDQTIAGTKTFSSTISGSVSGNAGTVTNGVYTTGDQTINGVKTFGSTILGDLQGNVTGLVRATDNNDYVNVNILQNRINIFDYGVINPVFTDQLTYALYAIGTDMGTIDNPSEFGIDAGTI